MQVHIYILTNYISTTILPNQYYNSLKSESSTLSHYGAAKKTKPVKAESHNLHHHINDLNTEKSQPSGDLSLRQHTV